MRTRSSRASSSGAIGGRGASGAFTFALAREQRRGSFGGFADRSDIGRFRQHILLQHLPASPGALHVVRTKAAFGQQLAGGG